MVRHSLAGLIAVAGILLSVGPAAVPARHASAAPAVLHAADLSLDVVRGGETYEVRLAFLTTDDDPEALAAVRDQYRARFDRAQHDGGVVRAAYALNGYTWPAHTATWAYNSAGKPGGLDGELALIAAAADTWGHGGADFAFTGGGTTAAGTGACHGAPDGEDTIGWAEQPGTVLGVTCGWFLGGTATEFDMELDPSWDWTTGGTPKVDFQSVLTHELGHALGLGHSSERGAVMEGIYHIGTTVRVLTADDRAALAALYGAVAPVTEATPAAFTLSQGANLVTWDGPDAPPAAAFAPVAGSLVVVYAYNAADGTWLRYLPEAPAYVSNLDAIRSGTAVWVIARSPATLPMAQ